MDDKSHSLAELLVARGYVQEGDLERVALVISQAQAAPKAESDKCPKCNGDGYTSEHSPALNAHDGEGNCLGDCPVQVQCEACEGTGSAPKAEGVQSAEELAEEIIALVQSKNGLESQALGELMRLIYIDRAAQRQAGREEAWKECPSCHCAVDEAGRGHHSVADCAYLNAN
jgi:hypothetical protein